MSRLRLTKVATPTAPATTKAELFYSLADAKLEAIDESGNLAVLGGFAAKDFRLIRVFLITAGGTYTPTAGTRALYVECVGGGGSGCGCDPVSSNASLGNGGGAGAYSAVWLTGAAIKASYTVAVGAGAAADSGGFGGSNGGDTTFDSPSVCTAKGGIGGVNLVTAGTAWATAAGQLGGAAASGVGDFKISGGDSTIGYRISGTQAIGSFGGTNLFSTFSYPNSGAGKLYGGGGNGALSIGTNASRTVAGAGANGVIRVWEFA